MNISKNKLPELAGVTAEDYKTWIRPKQRGFNIGCCDCGLVHSFNFRVTKYDGRHEAEFQTKVNDYMTNKVRRKEFKLISLT